MGLTYELVFNEIRHALEEVRTQHYQDAERTLEGVLLVHQLIERYRRRDPSALRLVKMLELEHLDFTEWRRSPEWLREQYRLQQVARGLPWEEPCV